MTFPLGLAWIPEFVAEGGAVMVLLIGCSVVALAVAFERALALRRGVVIPRSAEATLEAREQRDWIRHLERITSGSARLRRATFLSVVRRGLANRRLSREANEREMLMAGRRAAAALERGLVILELVAATAPLLGLLGTVLGMVETFDAVSAQGPGQADVLSSGIKKALYTTVAGLSICIPSLVAYTWFRRKAESLALEMERLGLLLLGRLYDDKSERT